MANQTFQLTKDGNTFVCDITGKVTSGGNPIGTWTTNGANQVVITRSADNSTNSFDVAWQFNDQNQLRVLLGATELANFHKGDALPIYSLEDDVLVAQPDSAAAFTFSLHATWDFDPTGHILVMKAGSQNSNINGFLQSNDNTFTYHFFDLAAPATGNESILTFPGSWVQNATVAGKPILEFQYNKSDGTTGLFKLPNTLNIDPNINEIVYDYDNAAGSFRVQFVGVLHISSDFSITYKLSEDTGSGTTFSLDAKFAKKDFTGNLDLTVGDSSLGVTITVGGNFTAVIGGSTLSAGFLFTQPASGNTQSFGFNGSFSSKTSNDLSWDFEVDGGKLSIDLTAQAVLGPVDINTKFKLTAQNGTVVGIHGLFGISF